MGYLSSFLTTDIDFSLYLLAVNKYDLSLLKLIFSAAAPLGYASIHQVRGFEQFLSQ